MRTAPACFRIIAGIAITVILLVPAVVAADIEMEGVLGDTFNLHGSSYVGDYVYLFMTGPGLPENGVTLTNTALRADQGQFTVVAVDDNQEWSYSWKTSRIANEIDPGTYTVYVTNEKADKAHLGGTSSYKTYSFFLKDSGESKVSIGAQHVYTLNPEEHVSTPRPAPPVNLITPQPAGTSPPLTTTIPETPKQTAAPTTRASTSPMAAAAALVCWACLAALFRGSQ
jgi:hypothetical protein